MKKTQTIAFFVFMFGIFALFPIYSDPVTPALLNADPSKPAPKIINYGYNRFIPSPYTKKNQVVTFDSPEGIKFFERSKHKTAFFKLAPHYSPQQTITNCGIASSIIILNTLYATNGKTPPLSLQGSHYDSQKNTIYGQYIWTENNFYTPQIQQKLDRAVVEGHKKVDNCFILGVSLDQLADTLKLQGLNVKAVHVKAITKEGIEQFRELVKSVAANPTQYLIAHYSLAVYLNDEGGHYSPIGAYDENSDSILILDTWAAANGWIWVKLEDLYQSMHTLDGESYRGYLLVNSQLQSL